MKSNFEKCLKWVLIDEGGNDDDPHDHGGRTSRGITQREYNAWCSRKGKPQGDVWKATDADVKSIYKDQYWNPYCDSLPSGLDYCFFDISVNSGRTQAVRNFQKALGVKVDGMMGQVTLNAIDRAEPEALIRKVIKIRREFYQSLSQFSRYGKGWMRRADHVEKGALALVDKKNYKRPVGEETEELSARAEASDADKPLVNPEAASTTAAGSGGFMSIIEQFKETLEPYADTLRYIQYVLLAIAVLGLSFGVYGFYKRRKIESAM